jgi:homoserine O-succinyltransferase
MPLVLPREHPAAAALPPLESNEAPLRVGIVNIMPRTKAYEPYLLQRLTVGSRPVEPVFVRLVTHGYTSSDHAHLERFYVRYPDAGRLDGLILTGAPVEELPFEEVHYWRELVELLGDARMRVRSVLGLCWGGLAIGELMAIPKHGLSQKLFGVFEEQALAKDDPLVPSSGGTIFCAQSRHAAADAKALARAAAEGRVRVLSGSPRTGTSIFATADHRLVAHLGHPEYDAERLVFEWRRDREAGRLDVPRPHGVDLENPQTTWRKDSESFFRHWLELIAS